VNEKNIQNIVTTHFLKPDIKGNHNWSKNLSHSPDTFC